MRIYKSIITILLFAFVSAGYAQEALSLSGAINKALKNNYKVKVSEKRKDIAEESNAWGAAGRFPTINFEATSVNRFDEGTGLTNPDRETHNLIPSVRMNWVLFDGFKIFLNKYKLEELQQKSEGNTAVVVENTIQGVILGYYNVLLEKEKTALFKELNDLSKDRYEKAKTQKELGSLSTFQFLQAQNSWLEDHANYLEQKVNYDNSIRKFNLLLGNKDNTKYELTDEFKAGLDEYEYTMLEKKMFRNNNTLKNQYINEVLQKREVQLAKASFLPKLILSSGYDYNKINVEPDGAPKVETENYDYYANLTLSLNIFNGFNSKRALEIAKIQRDISKIETEEMKHSLKNSLTQAFDLYNIRKELKKVADEKMDAAKLNLQIAKEKFEAGNISSFNYRDIQIVYLNSSLAKIVATFNLINTNTELMRLTGGIISEE